MVDNSYKAEQPLEGVKLHEKEEKKEEKHIGKLIRKSSRPKKDVY